MDLKTLKIKRKITVRHKGQNIEETGFLVIGDIKYHRSGKYRGKYRCSFKIPVIHPEEFSLPGRDPLEALTRTIGFVRTFVRGSIEDGFEIWWHEEGDDAGF